MNQKTLELVRKAKCADHLCEAIGIEKLNTLELTFKGLKYVGAPNLIVSESFREYVYAYVMGRVDQAEIFRLQEAHESGVA